MKPDGGPVFPFDGAQAEARWYGMTLRDHFAALALQGLLSSFAHPAGSLPRPGDNSELAEYAYSYADLMLAAREKL